jgi:hypothetical protein
MCKAKSIGRRKPMRSSACDATLLARGLGTSPPAARVTVEFMSVHAVARILRHGTLCLRPTHSGHHATPAFKTQRFWNFWENTDFDQDRVVNPTPPCGFRLATMVKLYNFHSYVPSPQR